KWPIRERKRCKTSDKFRNGLSGSNARSTYAAVMSKSRIIRGAHWFTPAKTNSRRLFKHGETMPEIESGYGATIWQWDMQQ
ncbi:hypothetical protein ACUHMQ_20900, partial [Chitinimonas sp. PSY-7]|uniref:hypothetical protein n=1 Tax=Chitinimonas sp. PSY-7 TaxID=3459088 RepID=UPI0040402675